MPRHSENAAPAVHARADVRPGRRRARYRRIPALGRGGPGPLGQRDRDGRRPGRRLQRVQGDASPAGRQAAARPRSRRLYRGAAQISPQRAGGSSPTARAAPTSISPSISPSAVAHVRGARRADVRPRAAADDRRVRGARAALYGAGLPASAARARRAPPEAARRARPRSPNSLLVGDDLVGIGARARRGRRPRCRPASSRVPPSGPGDAGDRDRDVGAGCARARPAPSPRRWRSRPRRTSRARPR